MNIKQIHARQQVAHEAARLMVESGIRDYQLAKRKAAATARHGRFARPPAQ